jgi:hypothetical protein
MRIIVGRVELELQLFIKLMLKSTFKSNRVYIIHITKGLSFIYSIYKLYFFLF